MQSSDVSQWPDITDDPSDKSDDDSGLSLMIADTSQIIAVIRAVSLTLSSLLPRNLNHGTLIGSGGIYKLPADWVPLPIN